MSELYKFELQDSVTIITKNGYEWDGYVGKNGDKLWVVVDIPDDTLYFDDEDIAEIRLREL